jgi:hypothetical protein
LISTSTVQNRLHSAFSCFMSSAIEIYVSCLKLEDKSSFTDPPNQASTCCRGPTSRFWFYDHVLQPSLHFISRPRIRISIFLKLKRWFLVGFCNNWWNLRSQSSFAHVINVLFLSPFGCQTWIGCFHLISINREFDLAFTRHDSRGAVRE